MKFLTCGLTDIGKVREENQDSLVIHEPEEPRVRDEKGTLLVVADGMGGLDGGGVASKLTVEAVERHYYRDPSPPDVSLKNAAKEANRKVYEVSSGLQDGRMMGSTVTAVSLLGKRAWIAQVGDSRAYLCRDGVMRQITKDHSLVQELADRASGGDGGVVKWTLNRNIVTRGLGLQDDVEVDLYQLEDLRGGDTILLSSDGFHELLEPEEMVSCLERFGSDLEGACKEYITTARERGGPDNITVALARVVSEASPATESASVEETKEHTQRSASTSGRFLPLALFLSFAAGVLLTVTLQEGGAVSDDALRELRKEIDSTLIGLDGIDAAELRQRLERMRSLLPEEPPSGE